MHLIILLIMESNNIFQRFLKFMVQINQFQRQKLKQKQNEIQYAIIQYVVSKMT